jgi:hypothetical protein
VSHVLHNSAFCAILSVSRTTVARYLHNRPSLLAYIPRSLLRLHDGCLVSDASCCRLPHAEDPAILTRLAVHESHLGISTRQRCCRCGDNRRATYIIMERVSRLSSILIDQEPT